jgi:hypothetical protein
MTLNYKPKVNKKKVQIYFLEFIMTTLAIILGFLAENVRESSIDKKVTNQYLETFKQELINNKIVFNNYDSIYNNIMPAEDSIVNIFYEKTENKNLYTIGRLLAKTRRFIIPPISISAYQQMVNSGGLKNILNLALKDSMAVYSELIQQIENYNAFIFDLRSANSPQIGMLEDFHDFAGPDHIPSIDPYPVLTERERRFIIYYYRTLFLRSLSDKKLLARLMLANNNLLSIVNNEIKKE